MDHGLESVIFEHEVGYCPPTDEECASEVQSYYTLRACTNSRLRLFSRQVEAKPSIYQSIGCLLSRVSFADCP